MATILKAGNVASGAQITSDATGILEIRTGTGAGTTAITVGTNQAVTFAAGTTVSSLTTSGAVSAGSLTVNSNNISAVNSLGFRNRIINGAMVIDQRNNGASVTISSTTALTYVVDRWSGYGTVGSKFSLQQNAGSLSASNRPAGFTNYLGATSLAATTLSAGDYYAIQQRIEGFNVADLGWGTTNAQTVTLSFWVRSSLTGTFGGSVTNGNDNRSYPFSYTISSANTWEQKSVTIAGDTTGTWATDNTSGIKLYFSLGTGSTLSGTANAWQAGVYTAPTGATSVVGTNNATFYITGVQLEAGSVATPFERRDYGRELAMCQRYFYNRGGNQVNEMANVGSFQAYSSTQAAGNLIFPVQMRAAPTLTVSANGDWNITTSTYVATVCTNIAISQVGVMGCQIVATIASGLTAGNATNMQAGTINSRLNLSAEL